MSSTSPCRSASQVFLFRLKILCFLIDEWILKTAGWG